MSLGSSDEDNSNIPAKLLDSDQVKLNDFVLVKFETVQSIYYVGKIVKIYDSNDFDVIFLRKNGEVFVYPLIEDKSQISRHDITAIIPNPRELAGTLRMGSRYRFDVDLSHFNIR